jgi:2-polyprenyl-6-methoxyphenol hydroxylase-like FAD-dependent oxidoreductase
VLLGDAAGYVDAITGEGLSLAFASAIDLAALLPAALAQNATALALAPFARRQSERFRRYSRLTTAVLTLARFRPIRRAAIRSLAASPRLFESLVAWGIDWDPMGGVPDGSSRL